MSQIKKGAILSYINIFLTNVIGLVLTPYIITRLGDAEYGLYLLIGSIVAYIALMDFGLNNTIVRFVAKYKAEKNKAGEENFLAITMILYFLISIITIGIGIIFYYNFENFFKVSMSLEEIARAKRMFTLLIFNLAITLPGGAFIAISNGYEHFIFPRALLIIKYISRTVLILTLLTFYPFAMTLVWIDTILNILVISISAFYVFKILNVRFKIYFIDIQYFKEIFSYSIWVFTIAIVSKLQWHTGQIILGVTANTMVVAIYGVGIMLGTYYAGFASSINTLLLPKATQMSVRSDNTDEYNLAIQKVGRINGFILFLILSGFFVYGKEFILLWVGETYLPAWEIALLIMIAMTLPLMQWFGNSILEAKKKNRFRSIVSLLTVSIAVVIALFLAPHYQLRGVIYPLFVAMILNSLIMSWYFYKIFGFNFFTFIKMTALKLFITIIPIVLFFSTLKIYWKVDSWKDLLFHIGFYSMAYFSILFVFLMTKDEKRMLRKI